jgi:membrane protease YdiL (CAAX protease family)
MIARRQWEALGDIVLCSGFPTQLAVTGLARLAGLAALDDGGRLTLRFVATVSAADTVLLLGLIWWRLRQRGESPRTVLLGHRPQPREVRLGLALAPLLVVFISAGIWTLRYLWPALATVPVNPLEAMAGSASGAAVLAAVAIVGGGVREEVQRGFLLHRFRDLGGPLNGVVITSIAFGLGHVIQGWDAVIITGLLGAFWGLLYLRRGSITAGLTSHALANSAQVLVAFLQRAA